MEMGDANLNMEHCIFLLNTQRQHNSAVKEYGEAHAVTKALKVEFEGRQARLNADRGPTGALRIAEDHPRRGSSGG